MAKINYITTNTTIRKDGAQVITLAGQITGKYIPAGRLKNVNHRSKALRKAEKGNA